MIRRRRPCVRTNAELWQSVRSDAAEAAASYRAQSWSQRDAVALVVALTITPMVERMIAAAIEGAIEGLGLS